jgi:hypothetical protein
MNILHIDFIGTFNEDMLYQENLITEYQVKDGHVVTMLTTCYIFDATGTISQVIPVDIILNNGVRLIRKNYKSIINHFITRIIRKVDGVFDILVHINPEIIFLHGPQTVELLTIVRYLKKRKDIKLYIDNHADFSNSASNFLSHHILHRFFWRLIIYIAVPYTVKFFGVIPARVDFLTSIYGVPQSKCELLLFGADVDRIAYLKQNKARESIRNRLGYSEEDFVIISGGKIDSSKKEIINLLDAITDYNSSKIRLLIFGSIIDEYKDNILAYCRNKNIKYLGWLTSEEILSYFIASDLGVFPGRHSVLWEHAVGSGLPCIFKYWTGTTHTDLGGNCRFLIKNNREEIRAIVDELANDKLTYNKMKHISENQGHLVFSYREIARKSIEC